MNNMELRAEKAKRLRYQKPICKSMNWYQICEDLWEIESDCGDIKWMVEDEEQLIDLLDGDEEQAFEFRIAFSDLANDCERMQEDLEELRRFDFMSEDDDEGAAIFDLFFPATHMDDIYMGFDTCERDYFKLDPYDMDGSQRHARKKLMRLTKEQILDLAGVAMGIARNYMSIMYRFKSMQASFEILKGTNESLIKVTMALDEAYEKCAADPYDYEAQRQLDHMLSDLPDRLWIE